MCTHFVSHFALYFKRFCIRAVLGWDLFPLMYKQHLLHFFQPSNSHKTDRQTDIQFTLNTVLIKTLACIRKCAKGSHIQHVQETTGLEKIKHAINTEFLLM